MHMQLLYVITRNTMSDTSRSTSRLQFYMYSW